jgi:hypothetical protein
LNSAGIDKDVRPKILLFSKLVKSGKVVKKTMKISISPILVHFNWGGGWQGLEKKRWGVGWREVRGGGGRRGGCHFSPGNDIIYRSA